MVWAGEHLVVKKLHWCLLKRVLKSILMFNWRYWSQKFFLGWMILIGQMGGFSSKMEPQVTRQTKHSNGVVKILVGMDFGKRKYGPLVLQTLIIWTLVFDSFWRARLGSKDTTQLFHWSEHSKQYGVVLNQKLCVNVVLMRAAVSRLVLRLRVVILKKKVDGCFQ